MSQPIFVNARSPIPVQADRLARIEARIARIEAQVATGDRLREPADDPAAAARAALIDRLDAVLDASRRAVERADSRLGLGETALAGAREAVLRARELALAAASDTLSADDRAILARELTVLRTQLLESVNSRDEAGRFLFAGARGNAPAFTPDEDGIVRWTGFAAGPGAEVAGLEGLGLPAGPELFGSDTDGLFATLDSLARALAEPDAERRRQGLSDALGGLERGFDRLVRGEAGIGAARTRLAAESDRIAAARLEAERARADVRGLDLTAALTELESLRLIRAASQALFSRIHEGTLFDRLV